jgi:protein-arginine kinase activator protein McsA
MYENLPNDILFLKSKLQELIEKEEYEKCVVIKRWIDELFIFYNIKK